MQIAGGASWADAPKAVAEASDVVFTSLPGPVEVEAVALGENGLLAGMSAGKVHFDLSTNSPTVVRRIHGVFKERGVHMLDAPVSGGPRGVSTNPGMALPSLVSTLNSSGPRSALRIRSDVEAPVTSIRRVLAEPSTAVIWGPGTGVAATDGFGVTTGGVS